MDFLKTIGQFFSKFLQGLFERKEANILFIGVDAAGKTTFLHKLKFGETLHQVNPTIGFNVETFLYKKVSFTIFDIGKGVIRIHLGLFHYLTHTIFIVDSSDHERFEEAAEMLRDVMQDETFKDCKLLVWANK